LVYTKEHGNAVVTSHRKNGALIITGFTKQIGNPFQPNTDTTIQHKYYAGQNDATAGVRRTVQPSKIIFTHPMLNSLNLSQDMQVVGRDPTRTNTSPAWRQLKHGSKVMTFMGIASVVNCNPETQIISAVTVGQNATVHIHVRNLLNDMRKMDVPAHELELSIAAFDKNLQQRATNKEKMAATATAASAGGSSKRTFQKQRRSRSNKKQRTSKDSMSSTTHTTVVDKRKIFSCTVCEKQFRLKHNLRNHARTHTGEKPFVCEHKGCGKRFNHGGNLLKHMRRCGISYEQRPYPCPVAGCSKRYMEACDLRNHQRSHDMVKSEFRGVTIERGRWKAQIGYQGRTHHIGTYSTAAEAALAYDEEAVRVHGAKAQRNFPGTRK
jgi:hypothetical protein